MNYGIRHGNVPHLVLASDNPGDLFTPAYHACNSKDVYPQPVYINFKSYENFIDHGCRRCKKSKALSSFQYDLSLQIRRLLCWILPSRNDEAFAFGDWFPFVQGGFKPILPVEDELLQEEDSKMINEFTRQDLKRKVCGACQCGHCTNPHCPAKCTAHIPCLSPVTKCNDFQLEEDQPVDSAGTTDLDLVGDSLIPSAQKVEPKEAPKSPVQDELTVLRHAVRKAQAELEDLIDYGPKLTATRKERLYDLHKVLHRAIKLDYGTTEGGGKVTINPFADKAVTNRLDTIELNHKVEITVPTQCGCGKAIDWDTFLGELGRVKSRFASWFGGYTVTKADGGYINDDGILCEEHVYIVAGYADDAAFQEFAVDSYKGGNTRLELEAHDLGNTLGQESVLIALEGREATLVFTTNVINCCCPRAAGWNE